MRTSPGPKSPKRSIASALLILVLMAAAAVTLGMALPLLRHLYEQPFFFRVTMILALVVPACLIIGPLRSSSPMRRKLTYLSLAVMVAGVQTTRLYHDYGSPSLWMASPEVLAFSRELVHILEYGFLSLVASRLLQNSIGGFILYLTAFAYAFTVGILDETVQWLHAFRVGDLRDVISNGISASIGLFYCAGLTAAPPPFIRTSGMWLALALAMVSPIFLMEFYLRTQTGYRICDERDTCFLSHFTAHRLDEESQERAERWTGLPWGALESEEPSLWAWEDYYLTEARAHLRIANQALTAGDTFAACGEIHILSNFYPSSSRLLGARPADYPCAHPPRGFHSQAFSHLDTEAQPSKMRWMGAAAAVMLAGGTALASRKRRPLEGTPQW